MLFYDVGWRMSDLLKNENPKSDIRHPTSYISLPFIPHHMIQLHGIGC